MNQPLDDLYFPWLCSRVWSVKLKNPSRTWWSLFKKLYVTEFVWFVPNDDNRVEDGRALRIDFSRETGYDLDPSWNELGCSFLEMLIGLSQRLAFESGGEPRDWFWHLMKNLELSTFNDSVYSDRHEEVTTEVLERVLWRQYHPSGAGGLFPLVYPEYDQRDIEIWYQMNAYLLERE